MLKPLSVGLAGYVPPLQPVEAERSADPSGLGLETGGPPAGLRIGEGC
ncbi:MAG: hypothetical protein LJE91_04805 [Gammaproteobacteria bacterium]|jgi:hypothetical protein|nr:hypothetical protein [Gammaproteobacteria bacterium]